MTRPPERGDAGRDPRVPDGPGSPGTAARDAAARAARSSYGRLLALLAAATRDVALAEDALGDAFARALERWPVDGVPDNPEGWLVQVARNRVRDVLGSAARRHASGLALGPDGDLDPADGLDVEALVEGREAIPDRRLELLFVCAHPAIEPSVRTPLMLQTVLGLEAADVARAFAVPPAAMAQRLVRAKRRIKGAGVPFRVPGRAEMPERLPAVMEAVYGVAALDAAGSDPAGPASPAGRPGPGLAEEARWLAVLLASLLGDEPEAWGLAALLTLGAGRAAGSEPGVFVPLEEQDPARWDAELLAEGEALLRRADRARAGAAPGRFQLEAAISSVHADRRRTGRTDWSALRTLYSGLVAVAPTLGARVALAAVLGRVEGPAAGLAALDAVGAPDSFQPAWATRAALLAAAGRPAEAATAYARAADLTPDPAVRAWLLAH